MRLDKTAYKKQSFSQASEHQEVYNAMSETERAEAFFQLMQAIFWLYGQELTTYAKDHLYLAEAAMKKLKLNIINNDFRPFLLDLRQKNYQMAVIPASSKAGKAEKSERIRPEPSGPGSTISAQAETVT